MALRMAQRRLNGFCAGNARDLMQPSAVVNPNRPNDAIRQLNALKRLARQNGTIKRVFRIQRREFPSDARVKDLLDQVYYRKWHHLKYCTQVVQYSIKRGLRLRDEAEDDAPLCQAPWAEGVPPAALGSGRLHRSEREPAESDQRGLDSAAKEAAERSYDRGFSQDELRQLAG
mmetsp:Transcript_81786/g.265046  ORF Transcript_81786/g.265046 Transcript_81786/m.265046 type:complete len:173 (-) Transcript_81786:29-547(-)